MFTKLCTKLWILKDNLKQDARGVSALEYAILIALVIGAAVLLFGADGPLSGIFDNATQILGDVEDATAPTTTP